ncbi:piggyBac transposable element-derived protein 2-like [Watersipora subatra]|uniref:piggyBac transposable element-derived protein 2-like n=1 Tax=Watersipora subatra TaxID=2589382 RepID=UPI00355BBC9D
MCQYTGKTSPCRQYTKSKPHPWGFKIWGRASVSGILHDFEVYQGGDGKRTELGQGADVVLKLTSTLQENWRYKIFGDNLFTSLPLISELNKKGMFYTGTVRTNRVPKCNLQNEKVLKRKGRGSYDSYEEEVNNVVAVRWYDNKAVTLLSSLTGVQPLAQAKRWDKPSKEHRFYNMPAIIQSYNKNMGGIDLLDSFLAKYRFAMKSRRWYLYLYWHFLMVAVINAWNVYRRDSRLLKLPKSEMLNTVEENSKLRLLTVSSL